MSEYVALTRQGIAAQQAGDRQTARSYFIKAIRANSRYEMAWLWLSAVVDQDSERRYCLDQAIAINPASQTAAKGLMRLPATAAAKTPPELAQPEPQQAVFDDSDPQPHHPQSIFLTLTFLFPIVMVLLFVGGAVLLYLRQPASTATNTASSVVTAQTNEQGNAIRQNDPYFREMTFQLFTLRDAMMDFISLTNSDFDDGIDSQWVQDMQSVARRIRQVYREVAAIDAPHGLEAFHQQLVSALSNCDQSGALIDEAVTTMNAAKMEQVSTSYAACKTQLEDVGRTLQKLRAGQN